MNIKYLGVFFLSLFISGQSFSQGIKKMQPKQKELEAHSNKIDRLSKIDYLAYPYQYLDKDYQIKMGSSLFNETVNKYKFYPEKIQNYKDSLSVVLVHEFNGDWTAARIAKLRITYTWERVGHYLILDAEQAEILGNVLGFTTPWLFMDYLNKDEKLEGKEVVLNGVRNRLATILEEENLDKTLSNKALLKKAFHANPTIVELREQYMKKHKH